MAFFHNRRLSSESSSICGPWCFITAGILKNLIPLSLFARLLQFITIQETGILDKIVGTRRRKQLLLCIRKMCLLPGLVFLDYATNFTKLLTKYFKFSVFPIKAVHNIY